MSSVFLIQQFDQYFLGLSIDLTIFSFPRAKETIHVRVRCIHSLCLEKLAKMWRHAVQSWNHPLAQRIICVPAYSAAATAAHRSARLAGALTCTVSYRYLAVPWSE